MDLTKDYKINYYLNFEDLASLYQILKNRLRKKSKLKI